MATQALACLGSRQHTDRDVVVVGGSFGGLQCALELAKAFRVTVLDNKDVFEFTPSMHTALGSPARDAASLFVGLDDALIAGVRFVVGVATGADGTAVRATLRGGEAATFPYDYLVVATGCAYPGPTKAPPDACVLRDERLGAVEAARGALARAATVLVLGGGAVGVEVAAELVEAKGGGAVTLATASDELAPDLPPATRNQALAWLRDRGATVLLATRAARVGPAPPGPFAGGDVDVGGERKAYGAVVTCFGAAPATAWLDGFAALDGRGFVSIDAATRRAVLVDADAKVFAVGDAAAKPDAQRLASYAHLEGEYVAAAVAADAAGAPPPAPYAPPPRLVCLSLGAYDGAFVYDAAVVPLPGRAVPLLKSAIEKWFIRLLPMPYAVLKWLPGDDAARAWSKGGR